ncbi:hypothetical protein SODALDRAFT_118437 [Sodiomyces alkalinus F11]|uniref:Uncharacterized protein n=1 Tax=Sodiomyces alkalinus (strain CBS 110278 / VKM F-3762 / F11) TaxID=1314773 RepID=A0A3N2Q3R0_SODAK|nr:hypothetical protein SODALDRAFT_118437 [Sodiomyces alkalinus F11]ROT41393.1 hypothetical protein SODALDRAFT_118437 [Sodiomyces alkalinus F11]
MTEPENFEEDLFADLYDDDTASAPKPIKTEAAAPVAPAAPEPEPAAEAAASAPAAYGENEQTYAAVHQDLGGGGGGERMYEDDDDDDDVDFNLGGGGPPPTSHTPHTNDEPTYSRGVAKNPSAKEDG